MMNIEEPVIPVPEGFAAAVVMINAEKLATWWKKLAAAMTNDCYRRNLLVFVTAFAMTGNSGVRSWSLQFANDG